MVGDGINDSLTFELIRIAMDGTDIAIQSADVILVSGDFENILAV
jgi:cation transport ATPase